MHALPLWCVKRSFLAAAQGQVVWEGTTEEFDTTDEPIVRQFASGSLGGPIKYE